MATTRGTVLYLTANKDTRDVTYYYSSGVSITERYDPDAPCKYCFLPIICPSVAGLDCCGWCTAGVFRDETKIPYLANCNSVEERVQLLEEKLLAQKDLAIFTELQECRVAKMTCSKGQKGRLKASNREFEIIDTTSVTSTIRFKGERSSVEISDDELRKVAVDIPDWSPVNSLYY